MIWGIMIPAWLKMLAIVCGAATLAVLAAFGMGKREARRDAKAKAANLKAVTKSRERDAELHQMDDTSLAARAGQWVRKPGAK